MRNKVTEAKIKSIIMTLLYANPHRQFTSRDLSEFINAYDFGIQERITPTRVGAILKDGRRGGRTFLRHVKAERRYNNDFKKTVLHYWVER